MNALNSELFTTPTREELRKAWYERFACSCTPEQVASRSWYTCPECALHAALDIADALAIKAEQRDFAVDAHTSICADYLALTEENDALRARCAAEREQLDSLIAVVQKTSICSCIWDAHIAECPIGRELSAIDAVRKALVMENRR